MRSDGSRRALSATIATVIIVAATITIALTVWFLYSGTAQSYFTVEKVDLVLAVDRDSKTGLWKLNIYIRNNGTKDMTISGVYLNGKRFWEADVPRISFYIENVTQTLPAAFFLPIGEKATIEVYLGASYQAGQNVDVKLATAAGTEITKTVSLP